MTVSIQLIRKTILMDVNGKVAIVTGASGGIGYAAAKLLASKGAKLVLVARSKDKLEKLAKELPDAIAVVADLSKIEAAQQMVKTAYSHFGRVDILVNKLDKAMTCLLNTLTQQFFNASLI
jgi:NADP-dependent 3-hydroxy acid dehydrogenase YdfG